MTCPDYDDEHTDSAGDHSYGDDEHSDSTDSNIPSGTDAADESDGGNAKLVPNLKLKAIRNIKTKAEEAKADLTENWTTSTQIFSSATGAPGPITVAGGGTAASLKTSLADNDIWDSPAAEECSNQISGVLDSIDGVINTIITDLTDAESAQVIHPGEEVEPDSPEATWHAAD
jgi:hypothetical protein